MGNTLITRRETEDLGAYLLPALGPELPRWLCCTGYGYEGITARWRDLPLVVGDTVQQHPRGEHHQNHPHPALTRHQATVPQNFHHARGVQ